MFSGPLGSLLGEMEEIGRRSASLIGEEQIAQINALKAHIESLENELREKNELLDLIESKRPKYKFPERANSILQHFLASTDLSQVEQLLTLESIEAERDAGTKIEKLLEFVFSLHQNHVASESRLGKLLREHVIFLENLCSGNIESPGIFGASELSEDAKHQIMERCKETTKFLTDNDDLVPTISDVLQLNFDPELHLENFRKFLNSDGIPYKELEALLWQESAIVYALRKRLEAPQKVTPEVLAAVREELEADIRKDLEDQIRLSIESDVREELENELRPEIRKELEDDVRTEIEIDLHESMQHSVRSQLEVELKKELLPEVKKQLSREMTPQIKRSLAIEIRNELTPRIKEEAEITIKRELTPLITKELRATLTPKVKAEIQKSVSPAIMKRIRDQAMSELQPKIAADTEREMTKKLRPQLEKQVRLEVEQSMQQERADAVEQMRSEIQEMKERLEEEIRNETQEDVRSQLMEELRPAVIKDCLEPTREMIQKALNLSDSSLSMLDLVEELASQVIKARQRLGHSKESLSQQIIDLVAENEHLDQLHTQTRSILVRQAEMISQLRTDIPDKWRKWAVSIAEMVDADCEDTRDEGTLRMAIQEAIKNVMK